VAHGDNIFACGPVAGLWNTDPEEKVLRLGKPTATTLHGLSKTIEFSDVGVSFVLTKGRAYYFTIGRPTGGVVARWRRYLNSLMP
jgi:hypothetical protein